MSTKQRVKDRHKHGTLKFNGVSLAFNIYNDVKIKSLPQTKTKIRKAMNRKGNMI